jgi:uncharacterized membrane protein YdbT with pleckstrin-like domain
MQQNDQLIATAQFDSRLPKYLLLQTLGVLLVSVITIPLMPFWAVLGWFFHHKQYEALDCQLTSRSITIKKGVLFKTQKNIPLDKITDLAVNEGPVLRAMGLCSLKIETAGGGDGSSMGNATLVGVVDALEFRDAVLNQRDLATAGALQSPPTSGDDVLADIRDTLLRIEQRLNNGE